MTFVIAVGGTSGAGKTTVVHQLVASLPDAIPVFFDDYETEQTYPLDSAAWFKAGGDPNALKTPQMTIDVRDLREGNTIRHPKTGVEIAPAQVIVLEEPVGRERDELRPLIDFVVYLELPLAIALARRLTRTINRGEPNTIPDYLQWYIAAGHGIYHLLDERSKASADLVVDATQPTAKIIEIILAAIQNRL